MIRRLKMAGLAAMMLLVGCTMIPRYRQPALPVPDQYPAPAVAAGANQAASSAPAVVAADISAHDLFRDERLKRLVDLALANNRDLRTAVLNVEQTEAQYRITRSASFPSVTGSAGFTRSHSSFSTDESALGGIVVPASSVGFTQNSFSASVGITRTSWICSGMCAARMPRPLSSISRPRRRSARRKCRS